MSKNICVFGDCIAWGAFDYEGGGWADNLKRYFFGKKINVYNLGISGDNSRKLVKRFKNECLTREPEIIIIAIGINDSQNIRSLNGKRVDIWEFEKSIKQITKEAKDFGQTIFVGPTKVDERKTFPVFWNHDREYINKEILKYNAIIKSVCEDNNFHFIEMFDLLDASDLEDGLHPNAAGHQKMFERIRDFLENNGFAGLKLTKFRI